MINDVESRVKKIIVDIIGSEVDIDEIGSQDELADWGLNSSGILKLIMRLEKEFEFECTDDEFDFQNFQNLISIISFVENKLNI